MKKIPHVYAADGVKDHRGEDRCLWCGLPRPSDRHALPPQPTEADERDAAVLGEHND